MACAQFRVEQVKKQHEIARKILELPNESELLKTQMKREEAMVSLNIIEEQSESGRSLSDPFYRENKELRDEGHQRIWDKTYHPIKVNLVIALPV